MEGSSVGAPSASAALGSELVRVGTGSRPVPAPRSGPGPACEARVNGRFGYFTNTELALMVPMFWL
jgi:hypothetical protein